MQEEFEKQVRERMHTFGIQPSHHVWDEIDAVLNKQKHRRVFVGWWILLGLVVMGSVVLLYEKESISRDTLNQQPHIISDSTNNRNLIDISQPAPTKTNCAATQDKTNKGQPRNAAAQARVSNNFAQNTSNSNDPPSKTANGNKSSFSFKSHSALLNTGQVPAVSSNATAGNREVPPQAVAKNTNENTALALSDAAIHERRPAQSDAGVGIAGKPVNPDSTAGLPVPDEEKGQHVQPPPNVETITQKRQEWFLTFSLGTIQTISFASSNSLGASATLNAPGAYYGNIPAITNLNVYNYSIGVPSTGFHASAGLQYERQLSTHWKIYGGLMLDYLTNTQQAGTYYKGNTTFSLANSAYNAFYISTGSGQLVALPAFYGPGNEATVVNKAWQAEVPVGLSYVANPKGKIKFMLNAGLCFNWIYSSQWLIPDARYNELYYSKTVFNNTAINWQAGPSIELPSHWKFGLQYQQSLTTVAKNYVTPKLYWQNISIYTAIPLGRKKKHGAGSSKDLF